MRHLCILVILFLTGCGSTDIRHKPRETTGEIQPVSLFPIVGDYETCYLVQSGKYVHVFLSFLDNERFTITTTQFSSPRCSGNLLSSSSSSGRYLISEQTKIDYYFDSGAVRYDIFNLNGSMLEIGYRTQDKDGSSPESRPTTYSGSIVYNTKQSS